jgi:hypothetical protein
MVNTAMDKILDTLEWIPVEESGCGDDCDGLPYVTHRGMLNVAGIELEVFQLSSGQRVISEESVMRFFGVPEQPNDIS